MNNSLKSLSRAIIASSILASLLIPSLSYSQTLNTSSQDQVAAIGAQLDTIKGLFNTLLGKLSGTLGAQVSGGSTTVVLQEGLNGYAGTSDTYIDTYSKTSNFGNTATMIGAENQEALVRFDLSSIPSDATVSSATLEFYISSNNGNSGGNTIVINHILNRNWVESQATWNVYATGSNWATPGLGSGTDHAASTDATASVGYAPVNVWAAFSITSLVQNWVNGVIPNNGVLLHSGNGPRVVANSSESTQTSLRPKLTITYTGNTTTPPPTDTTPPSQPTGLSATAVLTSQINLSWSASTDNVGATGYNIYRNGTQIASVANTSYNDTGLSASTLYTYYIRATDAAGNISTQSISASATTQSTTPPPTPAPTVTLSASPTSITSGSSSALTWSSTNATSCTASGAWSGTKTTSGSQTLTNLTTTGTYTLSCTGSGGTTNASATVTVTSTPPPLTGSFTFTATGDIGAKPETTVTLQNMLAQNGAFTLFLGDLSYNQLSPESAWCDYVKGIFGATYPVILEAGNHEDEAGDGALITEFAKCLPDRIGVTGTYGAEYYFDYPQTNPLARFIMLPAGMKNYPKYENGSASQQWLGTTIDQARAAGIKWIIVGMHMLCPTMGEKNCQTWNASPGPDLFNFLVSKKVDLVLHGHDHNYQRSKQFALGPSCTTIPVQSDATPNAAANLNCIVDSDDTLTKGAGTVIVISGITPNYQWPYSLFSNDPEAPYFRKAQNDNYGYTKVILSDTQLSAQFVATGKSYSGATSFTDSFTISPSGTTPPPSDTTAPSQPGNLSATAVSSSQINLSWSASTDNVGVMGYDIYRNSTFLTTTTGTSYSNTGLSANTTYSYYVRAKDAAGNTSAQSTMVSETTQGGTTPPPSTKFSLNDRVQVFSGPLNVRATASASGTLLGQQATGNLGTVIGGPIAADGFNWWNINYDNAPDGWSAEDYLVKYTAPTPPPSTDCSATNVRCVDDTAGSTQEYSTIQAAVNAAVAGDTVLVHDGTYQGFNLKSKSGTISSPIIIRGVGRAFINRNEPGGSGELIYTTFAGYFTIENFEIDCTTGTSWCMGIHSGGTTPNRGIVIRGNKVYNGQSTNIYLSHAADSLIENNITYSSRASHGIYLANGGSDNTIIRENIAYNNAKNGLHLNGDISVGGDGYHTGILVEKNIFYNNTANGMDIDGAGDSTFQNNLMYGNGANGLRAFAIDAIKGPQNLKIMNNTIITPGSGVPVKLSEDLGGHTIFNNILIAGGSNGSLVTANTNFKSANNAVAGNFSSNGGNTLVSLTSWQANGYDTNSFTSTASALFTNSAGANYTLKGGSPAIDKGVSAFNTVSAPTTDILGVSRQGIAYDIGAYEYASGTTTPPPTPAPTVTLSASPTSVTSGISSTLTWSSTNTTSCTASGAWSGTKATAGSQSITPTATGTYTLSCTGSGGTTNASATVTVTPPSDTTPPSTPTNLSATAVSSTQINLSWTTSIDPSVAGQTISGISGYRIYRSGIQIATSPTTSYSNTGLASYTVAAVDGATPANISPQSGPVSATTPSVTTSDTTAPAISLTAPAGNTTVSGTVAVSGTASDNIGVAGVQFKLDNINLGAEDTTSPYSVSWNTTSATNGFHTILAVARDAAGNRATSTARTVTVSNITSDTTKPTITITTPTTLATYIAPTGTVTLGGTASDNIGVTQVSWSNSAGGTGTMTGTANWNSTITLQSGTNTITVTGRDAAENTGTDTIAVTYTPIITDTQIPTTPTALSGTAVSTSQIDLTWTASTDNTAVTGYKVFVGGTQVATTTTTSYSHTNLSPFTTYAYTVSAYDAAGNTGALSSPLTVTTQAQTTAPSSSSSGGGSASSSGGGGGTTSSGGGSSSTGGTTASSGTTSSGDGGIATTPTTGITGETATTGGTTSGTGTITTFPALTGPFGIGQRGDQVKLLQQMLIKDGSLSSEATGYYGPLTQKAVETFQTKYNLVTSGTPSTTGFGLAGPGTRAKLNQLYGGASMGSSTDREALLASLRKQVADLMAILQTLIAKLAALKAAQGVR